MGDEAKLRKASGEVTVSAASPSLPNLNAETYPFDLVVHLLDQAAYLNMYSIPGPCDSNSVIAATGNLNGVIGMKVSETLHRFYIDLQSPSADKGVRAANVIGEQIGEFAHRWMIIPRDFEAMPDREPPSTLLDPSRSQRFVMLDGICRFGNGNDGFRGFGTGRTFPVTENGRPQLVVGAVGSILEGFGKFNGLTDGTYTYCGTLSPERGYLGNVLCRVMDPQGAVLAEGSLPALQPKPNPEPGITYLMFRGQKRDRNQKTTYSFGPHGQVDGLNVATQLRLLYIDSATRGRGGLRSVKSVGHVIGGLTAKVAFNPFNPGAPGTTLAPIPFGSYNEYTLCDGCGKIIGTLAADGDGEGRTFNMMLSGAPGQKALRFGAFGPIENGTGHFSGMRGLMTDNSVVGIEPHAICTLYILRIIDPEGRYRTAIGDAGLRTDPYQ